jgi:phage terminase large subunit
MIQPSEKQRLALHYLEHCPEVEQVLYGGAAFGGKSFLGCYWQIYRRILYPNTRGLIGRAQLKTLKLTTLQTFWKVWQDHWSQVFEDITLNYNEQKSVIYFSNGSEIYLKDIAYYPSDPDYHSLGSLEITDAFIDEGGETVEKAINIIFSRIRYNLINNKPAMLIASNPANNWLKWSFVMDSENQPIVLPEYRKYIQAKPNDNPDKAAVDRYVQTLNKLPLYDRLRLLEGDWSINENDAPFFHSFNADLHIAQTTINKIEPLYLSFDFNINPTTVVIGQKIIGKPLYVHKVIQVKGGTEKLCEEIEWVTMHPGGLIVTGDHSGNTGNTAAGMLQGGVYNTDFNIIKEKLRLTDYDFINTKKANPKHELSRRLCNYVFETSKMHIDPSCKVLIQDLNIAQVTDKGKLRKDREVFKMDACDAFRYLINAWFTNGFADVRDYNEFL